MNRIQILPYFMILITMTSCNDRKIGETAGPVNISLEPSSGIPQLFAENIVSTFMNERDLAISPDGKEIVFTLGTFNGSKRALAGLRMIENKSWSHPEIMPFSGIYQDIEPFFSPDGTKLFFASTRPITNDSSRKDYNIWYVDRNDPAYGGYGEPVEVGEVINTRGDEFYPSLSKNGNLYFTATYDYGVGREDIFVSEWMNESYQPPIVLDSSINSPTYEFNAYVSPDEDLIIFSSFGRVDGLGGGDLYLSQKDTEGKWTPARNLGEKINSSGLDYCPFIDFSRNSFYFTSNRSVERTGKIDNVDLFKQEYLSVLNGLGNIYQVHFSALELNN